MNYQLEKVTSPRRAIFRQVHQYYYFCEHIRGMSSASMLSKTYAINDFIRKSNLGDLRKINNQHIYNWIDSQENRGNTGRSINDRLAHLRAMLRWQREMGLMMPKLKLALIHKVTEYPPRKRSFSRSDIQRVLEHSTTIEWLLIRLCFDCGLRIGELQSLQVKHIRGDRITVIGKGQKKRHAFLCLEVQERLRSWIIQNKIRNYLWPSPIFPHRPLAICTIRSYLRRAFTRAGFTDFCPHDLRHSYATDLKLLGIPTRKIQAGLGHATESVTERYLSDLEGSDLREIYEIKYLGEAKQF